MEFLGFLSVIIIARMHTVIHVVLYLCSYRERGGEGWRLLFKTISKI